MTHHRRVHGDVGAVGTCRHPADAVPVGVGHVQQATRQAGRSDEETRGPVPLGRMDDRLQELAGDAERELLLELAATGPEDQQTVGRRVAAGDLEQRALADSRHTFDQHCVADTMPTSDHCTRDAAHLVGAFDHGGSVVLRVHGVGRSPVMTVNTGCLLARGGIQKARGPHGCAHPVATPIVTKKGAATDADSPPACTERRSDGVTEWTMRNDQRGRP